MTTRYFLLGDRDISPGITGAMSTENQFIKDGFEHPESLFMAREVDEAEYFSTLNDPDARFSSEARQREYDAMLNHTKTIKKREFCSHCKASPDVDMSLLKMAFKMNNAIMSDEDLEDAMNHRQYDADWSDISREDKASIWAILNASKEEIINGGLIPSHGGSLPNGQVVEAGNLGGIQKTERKHQVIKWFNLASKFDDSLNDEQFADKVLELREQLKFVNVV